MRPTPWKPFVPVPAKPLAPMGPTVDVTPMHPATITVPVGTPTAPPVRKSQLGAPWTGNDESLLERVFHSTNGGLRACYATFGSMRTRAAIRGKLQRLGLIPKRYVPTLNPS